MITRPINNDINKQNQQSFKSTYVPTGAISLLRNLNNKPALGACAVDICSMVTPRTVIETKNRGIQSGIETLFREGLTCLHHACLGLIGFGAAVLVSRQFNKEHGIKAQNIIAGSDTIGNLSNLWEKSEGNINKYFEQFTKNIKGLNNTEWKGISEKELPKITDKLVKLSDKTGELAHKKGNEKIILKKEIQSLKELVSAQIIKDTGAQTSFKLKAIKDSKGKVIHKEISSSLGELIDNAVTLSDAFKTKTLDKLPSFTNALKNNKTASTLLGLALCAIIGMSIQPLNRYLTKKRTGQDGFVGVENRECDNSKGFKALKTALGAAFPIFAMNIIEKPLLSSLQFNSKIPSLNHFKMIYSLTICSRIMSARDKNELRESFIKDTLGYTNWLLLGGMVTKLSARMMGGKELINNPLKKKAGENGIKYGAKWLTKASVKSFDEVLLPVSKEITKDGKLIKFSNLIKNADKATKSKILKIGVSQFAGYLYSGLVLGIGISKLNIFITKQLEERKNANKKMNQKVNEPNKIDTSFISKVEYKNSPIFKDFN